MFWIFDGTEVSELCASLYEIGKANWLACAVASSLPKLAVLRTMSIPLWDSKTGRLGWVSIPLILTDPC